MPQFSIPLSGLKASSTALTDIANNLANLNTTGYKSSETTFQDLYYQLIGNTGGGDPEQLGGGVGVASIDTDFTTGNTSGTGKSTNVAIAGGGFFIVKMSDGSYQYTRDGNFKLNDTGYLVDQNGNEVMGYSTTNGVVNTTGSLGPIQLGTSVTNPPVATTKVQLNANLNSATTNGTKWSTSLDVYDSLGQSHTVTFTFTKTAANTWNYQLTVPAADEGLPAASAWSGSTAVTTANYATPNPANGYYYQCTTAGTTSTTAPATWPTTTGATVTDGTATWTCMGTYPPVITTGNMTFDGSGNLSSPTTNVSGITIPNLASGATPVNFTWNLFDPTTGLATFTQTAATSTASSNAQNGSAPGTLNSFTIDKDGTVQGSFSNGTRAIGAFVTASFSNQEGLQRVGNNNYSATLSSGQAVVGTPGTGGRGKLAGSTLELSNVDMATEFSKLITAQRTFEANAKTITTFDEITQDTINLKR